MFWVLETWTNHGYQNLTIYHNWRKENKILTSTCTQQFIAKHIPERYGKFETWMELKHRMNIVFKQNTQNYYEHVWTSLH
jgi:hypothetical protein